MVVLIGFSLGCDFMDLSCVQTKLKDQLIISDRIKLRFVLASPPLDLDNNMFTPFGSAGCITSCYAERKTHSLLYADYTCGLIMIQEWP